MEGELDGRYRQALLVTERESAQYSLKEPPQKAVPRVRTGDGGNEQREGKQNE